MDVLLLYSYLLLLRSKYVALDIEARIYRSLLSRSLLSPLMYLLWYFHFHFSDWMRLFRDSTYLDFLFATGVIPDRNMNAVRDSQDENVLRDDDTDKQRLRATESDMNTHTDDPEQASPQSAFNSKKALWAFLVLCYSVWSDFYLYFCLKSSCWQIWILPQTGPTSSMVSNYVTAAILSAANLLGHQAGSDKPCSRRGTNISCLVRFGGGEIDFNSYTWVWLCWISEYLGLMKHKTIPPINQPSNGRHSVDRHSWHGRLRLLVYPRWFFGYSELTQISPAYRKTMMMASIFLFGALALPFAGLTGQTYSHLTALSVLYCFLTTIGGVYTVIEGSYIPCSKVL